MFVVTIASNDSSSLSFYNFSVIDNNGHQQTLMTLYRTKSCIDLSLNGSDIISTQHCFSYSVDDIESSRFLSKKVDVKSDLDKFSRLLLAGIFVYSLAPLVIIFVVILFYWINYIWFFFLYSIGKLFFMWLLRDIYTN